MYLLPAISVPSDRGRVSTVKGSGEQPSVRRQGVVGSSRLRDLGKNPLVGCPKLLGEPLGVDRAEGIKDSVAGIDLDQNGFRIELDASLEQDAEFAGAISAAG